MSETPDRLRRLASWMLGQAGLQGHRLMSERFAEAGLRKYHYSVLVALEEGGAASQADLGRRLSIDRSDMVAVINDLVRDGLVARKRDQRDRRQNLITLTPEGGEALKRLEAGIEEAQDILLEPLSARQRAELTRLLRRILEHHGERSDR